MRCVGTRSRDSLFGTKNRPSGNVSEKEEEGSSPKKVMGGHLRINMNSWVKVTVKGLEPKDFVRIDREITRISVDSNVSGTFMERTSINFFLLHNVNK